MALNTSTTTAVAAGSKPRLPGPDVVRAVALIGVVVMNYHGYLIIRGGNIGSGWGGDLFDPWNGPLSTRFAATFVLVAGVGVTLLTRSSIGNPDRVTDMRWRLARRGAVLYILGLLLEEIWNGTIIPFYGGMFAISALLFTLRARWVVAVGVVAVAIGATIRVWVFWQFEDGENTRWLTHPDAGSVDGYVYNLFVNGSHPLLPWLGYFCVGILLGRVLEQPWWRPAALGSGFMLYAAAGIAGSAGSTEFQRLLLSTHPASRGIVYVASALGTALIAYAAIDWLAHHFRAATDPFRRAGQMTLTLYIAHILVFNFVVDWLGWINPAGLGTSLLFASAFWFVGIVVGTWWHRRFGRGPAERIYRAVGG